MMHDHMRIEQSLGSSCSSKLRCRCPASPSLQTRERSQRGSNSLEIAAQLLWQSVYINPSRLRANVPYNTNRHSNFERMIKYAVSDPTGAGAGQRIRDEVTQSNGESGRGATATTRPTAKTWYNPSRSCDLRDVHRLRTHEALLLLVRQLLERLALGLGNE